MLVPVDKASRVIVDYLSAELEKVSDPVKRFAYRFAVGAMGSDTSVLASYAARVGVLIDGGYIDTSLVRNGLESAFSQGNSVCLLGLSFTRSDGDEIVLRMEQQ